MRGETHAPQVRDDYRMIAREYSGQGRPHVARIGEAVKHDDSRSVAADPEMDRRAVGLNVFHLETRWERLNPSCSRQGKPKGEEGRKKAAKHHSPHAPGSG